MLKILIITIVLFSTFAFSKQNFQQAQDLLLAKLSTTEEIIEAESVEWQRKFYQSLIDDEDPNIKLLGYSKRIDGFHGLDKKNSLIDIFSEFDSMIASGTLDHKSIATIVTICSYKKLTSLCNHEAIFERQTQAMTDNALIYLQSLNLAYGDDNQEGIKQAVIDIAQSTYIDAFMYLHEGFRIKLEGYIRTILSLKIS